MRKIEILKTEEIDENCVCILVSIAPHDIVFIQACIESYEGLATVRTENASDGTILVFTTPTNLKSCIEFLENIKNEKLF